MKLYPIRYKQLRNYVLDTFFIKETVVKKDYEMFSIGKSLPFVTYDANCCTHLVYSLHLD